MSATPATLDEAHLLERYRALLGEVVLKPEDFPAEIAPLDGLSPQFLRQHAILPLGVEGSALQIAVSVPVQTHVLDALRQYSNLPLKILVSRREDILAQIDRVYAERAESYGSIYRDIDTASDAELSSEEDLESLKVLAEDAPVVRLVQLIISSAVESRASDIHLEIYQNVFKVRYRIDGVLCDMESPPRRMFLPAISHLKLRARMNIAERRLPQDGRIKMTAHQREVDMRVSTIPTVYGESMVIRILDQGPRVLDLETLGFSRDTLEAFHHFIDQPHGMVLVTGPTGSGKTTTLYGALRRINKPENKIITVEDPVEYQIDGINQMQVKAQIDLTFATALRSIVRQDPDVIMVGEIRDRETAEIAIQSALTGHLVFSTLHTNDSFGAPHRLLEMGVESYLIASSVLMILAQRLVRMICPHCKVETEPTEADKLFLHQEGIESPPGLRLHKGAGCTQCAQTGYIGRTGIYELLPMTPGVKEAIIRKAPAEAIRDVAIKEGVRTMRSDGLKKVLAGLTTLEELARVTRQES
jgi:type II secretion system protein E